MKQLIHCSPSGFPAWLAHVQGSNAIIRQFDGRNQASVVENLFLRQLRFVIVSERNACSYLLENPANIETALRCSWKTTGSLAV